MNEGNNSQQTSMAKRFRGFLPVVIDVETAGINPSRDALLEIGVVILAMNQQGQLVPEQSHCMHVAPFKGANLDQKSLDFNKIDPFHPFRFAKEEQEALIELFTPIRQAIHAQHCQRAVLVGHNAWFDLLFLKAASERCKMESPFHSFTCIDTASLASLLYGQTVLAKAMQVAKIAFDQNQAHSALYDAEKTAELYCKMVNDYRQLDGLS